MKQKIINLFVPYLLISIIFLITYSFLYWIINNYEILDDSYIGFWGPAIISAILVYFVIRKKINVVLLSKKHKEFIYFSTWILLAVPVVSSTFYIHRASGKITTLKSINEINSFPTTLYYSIENTNINKDIYGFSFQQTVVDRGNELAISCFYICPIDINENTHKVWIGKLFGKKFSNRILDDKAKQKRLIQNYIDSSIYQFQNHQFQTKFLKRTSHNERNDYLNCLKNIGIISEDVVILVEQDSNYENRTGSSLKWTIVLLILSNIVFILSTIFQKNKNVV